MLMKEFEMEKVMCIYYEDGIAKGREQKSIEVARNLLAEGSSIDFVQKITGLDINTVEDIEQNSIEIARKALVAGASFDLVQKITGLDIGAIESIQAQI